MGLPRRWDSADDSERNTHGGGLSNI